MRGSNLSAAASPSLELGTCLPLHLVLLPHPPDDPCNASQSDHPASDTKSYRQLLAICGRSLIVGHSAGRGRAHVGKNRIRGGGVLYGCAGISRRRGNGDRLRGEERFLRYQWKSAGVVRVLL